MVAGVGTRLVCYTADLHRAPVFENFRQALNDLLRTAPEDRRALLSQMRDTLAQARAGLDDLRDGLKRARDRLAAERRELETVRRRKRLATDVGDRETVTVAERFEAHHVERVQVLEQKVAVQERELSLAEAEVEEMTRALKAALSGATPPGAARPGASIDEQATREVDETLAGPNAAEFDSMSRARARKEREAEAERRLEELKRRMGKESAA